METSSENLCQFITLSEKVDQPKTYTITKFEKRCYEVNPYILFLYIVNEIALELFLDLY